MPAALRVYPHWGAVNQSRVANATQSWQERRSLLIEIEAQGVRGYGEISPLPGYSPDTLESCNSALSQLDPRILSEVDFAAALLPQLAAKSRELPEDCPAARCGLEMALLDLWGKQSAKPSWALMGQLATPFSVSALIGSPLHAEAALRAAHARGITHVKFKVGAQPLQEAAQLQKIYQQWGPALRWRLDANQALGLSAALQFWTKIAELPLEFWEEPVAPAYHAALPAELPLALDESLLSYAPGLLTDRAELPPQTKVLVLKPMLLGGLARSARLAQAAHARGIQCVLSHLFDGPRALAAYAALAFTLDACTSAQGLDPHAGLAAWPNTRLPAGFKQNHWQPWAEPGLAVVDP